LIQSQTGKNIPEKETDVCEGVCPPNYNRTANGFCLKLYSTPANRDDAEAMCKTSGGSLIHIDKDAKYDDVKALLTAYDEKQDLHIDGRRKNTSSPWEYSYGSKSDYFYWYPGHPSKGTTSLCLMLTGHRTVVSQQFLWFSTACSSKYAFICEG
jgi:hypothetical protein